MKWLKALFELNSHQQESLVLYEKAKNSGRILDFSSGVFSVNPSVIAKEVGTKVVPPSEGVIVGYQPTPSNGKNLTPPKSR